MRKERPHLSTSSSTPSQTHVIKINVSHDGFYEQYSLFIKTVGVTHKISIVFWEIFVNSIWGIIIVIGVIATIVYFKKVKPRKARGGQQ